MPVEHSEKPNDPEHGYCVICTAELSEEQRNAGMMVCSPICEEMLFRFPERAGLARLPSTGPDPSAHVEKLSGRSLAQIAEDLRADASEQPLESARLESDEAASILEFSECIKRHPKIQAFILERQKLEDRRERDDSIADMLDFVEAWENGTFVAKTVEAQRSGERTAERFKKILAGPDKEGMLEEVFGLRGPGRTGKRPPPLTAARERIRDEEMLAELVMLIGWFPDFTVSEDAKMVCARCERDVSPELWKEFGLTPEKLERIFSNLKLGKDAIVALAAEFESPTHEELQQFIERFPRDSRPERLKNYFS